MAEREHRENPLYMVFMLVLSALSLLAIAVATRGTLDPQQRLILDLADNVICALFLLDFLYCLKTAPDRWRYFLHWGWLDLLSAVPMVDALRTTRLARIVRLIRLIRAIKATKVLAEFILDRRAHSAFLAVSLLSVLLIVVSSIAVLQFEDTANASIRTAEDALWWALATITTVGYGDAIPTTTEGRLVASMLMICGVGLYGTLSGFVASWFLRPSHDEHEDAMATLLAEVRALRVEVGELRSQAHAGADTPRSA